MSNRIKITVCQDCADWSPADSYGCGVYCDELGKIVCKPEDPTDEDGSDPIPDCCPKLNPEDYMRSDEIIRRTRYEMADHFLGMNPMEIIHECCRIKEAYQS